ncbi:MAG: TetR/AcrR family transcriptional regulator [Deltaproteobacteria bacterium]|nr:TetR/AcrR family transcriptional regulator [Deltaproteobacteria bacterium]
MPKPARPQEAVDQVRKNILDAALEILYKEGFASLSMRKIAKKTGMTAANIYNYFKKKDEIYLAIQTRGFAKLFRTFRKIEKKEKDPVAGIKKMISAYIDFGTSNPDQYEIMFTRNTPKYADYLGTPLEPAARIEKETAMRVAETCRRVLSKIPGAGPDAAPLTISVWTALHGLVSLVNSRVLQEVEPDVAKVTAMIESTLLERLTPYIKNSLSAKTGGIL